MKSNIIAILIGGISLFSSCGSKDYQVKVKLLSLSDSTMYNEDLVSDVIFDAEENNIDSLKDKSRELFLKGIDLYKNKKDIFGSIKKFKASILVFPDAKTYYELGNALLESHHGSKSLQEAIDAFHVAEHLNFQPLSNIEYKMACANVLLSQQATNEDDASTYRNRSMNCLRQAFYYGFTDTLLLNRDPKFASILNDKEYIMMVVEAANKAGGTNSNQLFTIYRNSFPTIAGRFEIPADKVDMGDHKESVSYDFAKFIPEMENTSFGRDVSHDFFYVANVGHTSNYTALIYSSVNFMGQEMQPVHTTLVTYNNQGEVISKKLIACQCSAEKIKTVNIDNNKIHIVDYKRIWEQPIDKVSFEENKVTDYDMLAEATFRIDESGKIVDEVVPQNYNDSTIVAIK